MGQVGSESINSDDISLSLYLQGFKRKWVKWVLEGKPTLTGFKAFVCKALLKVGRQILNEVYTRKKIKRRKERKSKKQVRF